MPQIGGQWEARQLQSQMRVQGGAELKKDIVCIHWRKRWNPHLGRWTTNADMYLSESHTVYRPLLSPARLQVLRSLAHCQYLSPFYLSLFYYIHIAIL
jgi:hypothetical protein